MLKLISSVVVGLMGVVISVVPNAQAMTTNTNPAVGQPAPDLHAQVIFQIGTPVIVQYIIQGLILAGIAIDANGNGSIVGLSANGNIGGLKRNANITLDTLVVNIVEITSGRLRQR